MDMGMIGTVLGLAGGAASALSSATSAASGLKDLTRKSADPAVYELALSLYGQLLEARSQQVEMQVELGRLADEIRSIDRFEEEAARFTLTRTEGGGIVWKLTKPKVDEPLHYLCPRCVEERVISRLQRRNDEASACPKCGTVYDMKQYEPIDWPSDGY